jgi:hypothetical protein
MTALYSIFEFALKQSKSGAILKLILTLFAAVIVLVLIRRRWM